jgi:hypothetical protein
MIIVEYKDLDCPVVAGQYPYNTILVDVGASQISEWDSDPQLRFALVHTHENRYAMEPPAT